VKAIKGLIVSLLFVSILFTGRTSYAGIPVFDGANLAQAVSQVMSWVQQYKQMMDQYQTLQQQYQQMQQEYQSMTGARNLGDIFNNQQLKGVVPQDLSTVYNSINTGGYSGLRRSRLKYANPV